MRGYPLSMRLCGGEQTWWGRLSSVRAMNNQIESARSTQASFDEGNRLAIDSGLVSIILNRARKLKRSTDEDCTPQANWRLLRRNAEFMAVFSHEMRNSLNAIRSAAYVLRVGGAEGPAVEKAGLVIERQVAQMTRFVEDLLDVSRIRNGQLCLQPQRIDLRTVVAHSAQTVETAMQKHGHRLTTSFPDAPLWLHADAIRLEQVFVNLLVNAAKYTDAGGNISLFVEREADEAVIRICDDGIGITADMLPRVFDLYVQVDPSSPRAGGGLGIGLALVRSLIESHGGRVSVTSAGIRQGSEFTVRLPVISSE